MSEQRDHCAGGHNSKLPGSHRKVDKGYQQCKHYLMDQLRYSDSVQDFRSVKQAILRSTQFSIGHRAFQFAKVPVEVRGEQPRR